MPRSAGKPHVVRVVGHCAGLGKALLAVGLREHDLLDELLQIPGEAAFVCRVREPPGELVEQLRILRRLGLAAQVF